MPLLRRSCFRTVHNSGKEIIRARDEEQGTRVVGARLKGSTSPSLPGCSASSTMHLVIVNDEVHYATPYEAITYYHNVALNHSVGN